MYRCIVYINNPDPVKINKFVSGQVNSKLHFDSFQLT